MAILVHRMVRFVDLQFETFCDLHTVIDAARLAVYRHDHFDLGSGVNPLPLQTTGCVQANTPSLFSSGINLNLQSH